MFNNIEMEIRCAIEVNCYSGHTYPERPESFVLQGDRHEISGIRKSWSEPAERHFLVQTAEKKLFHLCYNEIHKEWALIEHREEDGNDERNS